MAASVHVRSDDSNDSSNDDVSITSNEIGEDGHPQKGNLGMADVIGKILQKNAASTSQSKAKKRKREEEVEMERGEDDSSDDEDSSHPKRLWENLGREKIDPLDKDRERQLQKVAIRGVVQLFNAVSKEQRSVEEKCKEVRTEAKREKILKSRKKGNFLDLLSSTPVATVERPKWKVLQDDFLQGSAMKEWDRDSGED